MVGVLLIVGILVAWYLLDAVLEKGIDTLFDGVSWVFRKREPDATPSSPSKFVVDDDSENNSDT